jgi:hypothetical protein
MILVINSDFSLCSINQRVSVMETQLVFYMIGKEFLIQ